MEESKIINDLTAAPVVDEPQPKQTGIIPVNEYFSIMPDPAKVAQRAETTKGMLTALTRVISPCNITDFGGKPYFDHLACERIAKIIGLVIKFNETESGAIAYEKIIEDATTNKYTIYLTGKIYYSGREQDYELQEGSSCSFDDWYSKYQNVDLIEENGKKKKIVLNANALPESKVREKARANLIQRLVKKFLGLDFTWQELEKAGIDRSKCKGFTFSGNKGADTTETVDTKKDIWNKILEVCGNDVDLAKKSLQKLTAFQKNDGTEFKGYTDINKVSEKMLGKLADKVDKRYSEYVDSLGGKEDAAND